MGPGEGAAMSRSGQPSDYAKESRPGGLTHSGSPRLWSLTKQRGLDLCPLMNRMGGLSLLLHLERYYESSVPDSIAATIWYTGTTKKSHAYVTIVTVGLSWTPVGHASGFHSHHHIDDQSPRVVP
ncbi:hypothetical protein VNO80_03208 [Phaseolus coccineus]|uniref:Uncharacterized protein n=1 Tax=Phaseolus coccineus TaxID=3886 RepID=A0AAN9NR96_PHACN